VYNEAVWLPTRNIHIIAKSPVCTRRLDVACIEQIYFQHISVDYIMFGPARPDDLVRIRNGQQKPDLLPG
jgi:hypothetical protein